MKNFRVHPTHCLIFTQVLEAKKQLASPHHRTAEDRVRLCRDLVRAAIDGGSKASSPSDAYKHWTEDGGTGADALAGVLLRRAAAGLRKNLGERYDLCGNQPVSRVHLH